MSRFFVRFVLLLGVGAGSLCLAPPADAQNRSDRYQILVSPHPDGCQYQIEEQVNQDLFIMRPGGQLTVDAREGLWVDVTVEDDARGIPGTRNRRSLSLRQNESRAVLTARSSIGKNTEHRVRIQCCKSRNPRAECPAWTDAVPPTTTTGSLDAPVLPPERTGIASSRGPAVVLAPVSSSPLPAGGPVMQIEE
jgi:hypothetical protein